MNALIVSLVAGAFGAATWAMLRSTYRRHLRFAIAASLVLDAIAIVSGTRIVRMMAFETVVLAAWALAQTTVRRREVAHWRDRPQEALVLRSPGGGTWRVAVGGPFSKGNHHVSMSGERFAYDLVCVDRPSFGAPIVSPVDGFVEDVRASLDDFVPRTYGRERGVDVRYGNFVSIRTERGRVLLCHLRKNSVAVARGQHVVCGDVVGACGSSGRSFEPHLHIHAQSTPAASYGDAVAIAFVTTGRATTLGPGDLLRDERCAAADAATK